MKNKSFFVSGDIYHPSKVKEIMIFESPKKFKDLVTSDGKNIFETYRTDARQIRDQFLLGVEGVKNCTDEFITSPPAEEEEKVTEKTLHKKVKIFIVHGRDELQALRLQKFLTKIGIDAEIFEDFKERTTSKTIIEQLEYIREKVGYAFVIATPDDLGVLCEDKEKSENQVLKGREKIDVTKVFEMLTIFKTRARQNVVFELGLFIGTLGRDKVCCLLQTNVQERPSDIDGILYVGFEKSVKEKFSEIEQKLQEIGLVKT
jgi:predicted nucleotide-binding protein